MATFHTNEIFGLWLFWLLFKHFGGILMYFARFIKAKCILTWIARMLSPVSLANCSLICRVGLGVCEKAGLRIFNCCAFFDSRDFLSD